VIADRDTRKARQQAVQWVQSMLADDLAVILDVETTGMDEQAEVIQVGLLTTRGKVLLDALLRPANPIPRDVTLIHGIADADVALATTFNELHSPLRDLLVGRTVVAYNAAFEYTMLKQTCERYFFTFSRWDEINWQCAMKRYAEFNGKWNAKYDKFQWVSLVDACWRLGIAADGAHSAIGDCRLTLEVLKVMAHTQTGVQDE
jgi:DNA polymerase-3 subunit epsilon